MGASFAISIDRFPKDESGNTNWPLNYVCGLLCKYGAGPLETDAVRTHSALVGISFAVSIPFIVLALYIEWIKEKWYKLRHIWTEKPLHLIEHLPRGVKLPGPDRIVNALERFIDSSLTEYDPEFEHHMKQLLLVNEDMEGDGSYEEDLDFIDKHVRQAVESERRRRSKL
jgi:hypothetical protein